ncbi:MAG: hypothetical protein LBS03_02495 [Bacteroidales bacterium]|nr:hypothetical protein [Bacteroidales bacterium]
MVAVWRPAHPSQHRNRKQALSYDIREWTQYFRPADMKSDLQEIDEWMRRRLRTCTRKLWKRMSFYRSYVCSVYQTSITSIPLS